MATKQINLKISYDPEVDAAYIHTDEIDKGNVANTFTLEDESGDLRDDINVDVNKASSRV